MAHTGVGSEDMEWLLIILSAVTIVIVLAGVGCLSMLLDDVHNHINTLETEVHNLEQVVKYYSECQS